MAEGGTSARASIAAAPEVLVKELSGGEAVLLHLGSEEYFGLNPIGVRMWQVLTSTGNVDVAHEQLRGEFEVDDARLRADLERLVEKLVDRGLLVQG